MSRVPRRLDVWILVPDTRRNRWDDGAYPAEFRRKVLDLLADGSSVARIAHDLEISDQTIYGWRRQDRIDGGLQPGLSTAENAELAKAKKRIAELEAS